MKLRDWEGINQFVGKEHAEDDHPVVIIHHLNT